MAKKSSKSKRAKRTSNPATIRVDQALGVTKPMTRLFRRNINAVWNAYQEEKPTTLKGRKPKSTLVPSPQSGIVSTQKIREEKKPVHAKCVVNKSIRRHEYFKAVGNGQKINTQSKRTHEC